MGHPLPILSRTLALTVAIAFHAISCAPTAPAAPPQSTSTYLTTLSGEQTTLEQIRGGRPALVVVWATWCEACRDEFVSVARLAPKIANDAGLVFLSVGEDAPTVQAFVRDHPLPGVVLLDPAFSYADKTTERRVPTTLVIDRHGAVAYRGGALDAAALATLREVIASN